MFPKIDSPCPLRSIELPADGSFHCDVCSREVHNLSVMSETDRAQLLNQCSGKICISYKVKMTMSALKASARAGLFVVGASSVAVSALATETDNEADPDSYCEIFTVGGIHLPASIDELADADAKTDDSELALIPVVVEE